MKQWIEEKDGRAYLHWKSEFMGVVDEGIIPLGTNVKVIKSVADSLEKKGEV